MWARTSHGPLIVHVPLLVHAGLVGYSSWLAVILDQVLFIPTSQQWTNGRASLTLHFPTSVSSLRWKKDLGDLCNMQHFKGKSAIFSTDELEKWTTWKVILAAMNTVSEPHSHHNFQTVAVPLLVEVIDQFIHLSLVIMIFIGSYIKEKLLLILSRLFCFPLLLKQKFLTIDFWLYNLEQSSLVIKYKFRYNPPVMLNATFPDHQHFPEHSKCWKNNFKFKQSVRILSEFDQYITENPLKCAGVFLLRWPVYMILFNCTYHSSADWVTWSWVTWYPQLLLDHIILRYHEQPPLLTGNLGTIKKGCMSSSAWLNINTTSVIDHQYHHCTQLVAPITMLWLFSYHLSSLQFGAGCILRYFRCSSFTFGDPSCKYRALLKFIDCTADDSWTSDILCVKCQPCLVPASISQHSASVGLGNQQIHQLPSIRQSLWVSIESHPFHSNLQ